jgi:hypothetical protein
LIVPITKLGVLFASKGEENIDESTNSPDERRMTPPCRVQLALKLSRSLADNYRRRLRTFGVWVSSPARETGRGFFLLAARKQIAAPASLRYSSSTRGPTMNYLTKEQQKVLCVILLLLLTGLAVKTWRTGHPPKQAAHEAVK